MGQHDEVVGDFLIESYDNLFKLDRDLVTLEEELNHHTLISSIFRTIHTLKSASGFLGFAHLETLADAGEGLLMKIRDGELRACPAMLNALLSLVDAVRQMLASIETTGGEGKGDFSELETLLVQLQDPDFKPPAEAPHYTHTFLPFTATAAELLLKAAEAPEPPPPSGLAPPPPPSPLYLPLPPLSPPLDGVIDLSDPMPERLGEMLIKTGRVRVEDVVAAVEAQRGGDPRRLGEILVERAVIKPEDLLDLLRTQQDAASPPLPQRLGDLLIQSGKVTTDDVAAAVQQQVHGDTRRLGEILIERAGLSPAEVLNALNVQSEQTVGPVVQSTVRLETALVDRLVNHGAELAQRLRGHVEHCDAARGELEPLVDGLIDLLFKMRMLPLKTLWSRLPRFARDLATSLGKRARMEVEGSDIQLDRAVVEGLKDPLTHLLRNAIDHGLETPAQRMAARKAPEGMVRLRATLEEERVVIEVTDDGNGIDASRVVRRAVQQGMLTPGEADMLSDAEALRLIFAPGFSMARQVTHISGRGVGMDAVKTRIERLGGTVEVDTCPGVGTTFRLRIPHSMHGARTLQDLNRIV